LLLLTAAGSVEAAWHNVFQVCCHGCRSAPAVSYYAAAPCCPQPCCPQPVYTTRYVQRCYYQPVTTYQTQTYYQPVTTYQTSYYYEPVVSYRYSCYFDPCTCCYQQVATPVTCYRLRSQCNAVQSYVQRCCTVPVTTYQQACYYEPVTTVAYPCSNGSPAVPPAVTERPPAAVVPPAVTEQRQPSPPAVTESPGQSTAPPQSYYAPTNPTPPANPGGTSYRQWPSQTAPPPLAPAVTPRVRLDRIVSSPRARVEGQLVRAGNLPWAGAKVLFARAERQGLPEASATADAKGSFQVSLASGSWLVYVPGADGKPSLHSRLDVRADEVRQVTLVSR
jgi:hypothetical protein